ncbi:polysaccharide deacetylase family protein [Bacillus daqingensis]|uniref:Polysaccharide deacetylase family protein n=1 Tax=Bacillus daqingensis TaxID=872396 RepID=A0ABV9NU20_9BACI
MLLTFDDGPGRQTEEIVSILNHYHVKALFFWQGHLLHHKRPFDKVLQSGHVIGTHAHHHIDLTKQHPDRVRYQLRTGKRELENLTGQSVTYFRPPYGKLNRTVRDAAEELKLETILWNTSSYDWDPQMNAELIIERASAAKPNSIILLHEKKVTVQALPGIIEALRANGQQLLNRSDQLPFF